MKVSILIPSCNQGDELRKTVASARAGIAGVPHEIIVADDQSTDGSTRGLPMDVLVLHAPRRVGCSGARKMLAHAATGDVLLWSDPHCRYPVGGLAKMAIFTERFNGIVHPVMQTSPTGTPWFAASYRIAERGLAMKRSLGQAHSVHPGLYGSIYCMRRDVYDFLGGWPQLPGVWGGSEQALTLMAWVSGVRTIVVTDIVCEHHWSADRKFPFTVPSADPAKNAHCVHRAFFPTYYRSFWRPLLLRHPVWGDPSIVGEVDKEMKSAWFKRFCEFVGAKRLSDRTEEQAFRDLLQCDPPKDEEYQRVQERISQAKQYVGVRWERTEAVKWLKENVPAAMRGRALDVGTRDGFVLGLLKENGVRHSDGIDISAPAVAEAVRRGLNVIQADMRDIPVPDASYDLVTCLHALEHCQQPVDALREMGRVLKPGGWLYVVVPRERITHNRAHYCCFGRIAELESAVLQAGFSCKPICGTGIIGKRLREIRLAVQKGATE